MNRKTFSVRALALLGAFGLSALTLGSAPAHAQAQAFPTKPVSLMEPYAAGGLSDAIARVVEKPLSKALGQMVMGEKDIFLSGRRPMPKASPHTLWITGSHGFQEYTEKDAETMAPELVIYGGTRLVHAYEDMELFDFKDIPSVNLYQKGMQEIVYKNGWKLVTSD